MLNEKQKKAVSIAVAQFLEEEAQQGQKKNKLQWADTGRAINMSNRIRLQRRGKLL